MQLRKSLLCTFTAGALLFAGATLAQEAPVPAPPPPPATPMPPPPPVPAFPAATAMPPAPQVAPMPPPPATPAMTSASGNAATYQTAQGELTVRSVVVPAPIVGPAPAFEQLSGGSKVITEGQAEAYPPLANDFINADHNRNGSISAAEYQQWSKQL